MENRNDHLQILYPAKVFFRNEHTYSNEGEIKEFVFSRTTFKKQLKEVFQKKEMVKEGILEHQGKKKKQQKERNTAM